MRHHLEIGRIVLLGGFLLFMLLALLVAIEPQFTGRATAGTAVNITESSPANCSVTGGPGLNTISFPCITTAEPRESIINGSGIEAMYQYLPGTSDPWKVYNPNLPSYVVHDLQHLSRRVGYVLILGQERTFNASGLLAVSTGVPIVAGWSLVGYPSLSERNASDAFTSINDSMTQAQTFNNSGGVYLIYDNPGGGTLTIIRPGQGYWINATQGDTWAVSS